MPATTNNTPWGNQTRVLTPEQAEAGGYHLGDAGYYLDDAGDLAPGQVTPGQRDNPQGQVFYDQARDLQYFQVNGQRVWISPGVDPATGVPKQSMSGPPITDTGGGMIHGNPMWNPQTGTFDVGLDWGKVLSWAIATGLTAGVLTTVMAGGAGAAGAAGAGTGASTAAGGGTLASTTIGTGFAPGIVGGTGIGASAGGAAAGGGIGSHALLAAFGPEAATGTLPAAAPLASTAIGTGLAPGIAAGTGSGLAAAGGGTAAGLGTVGTIKAGTAAYTAGKKVYDAATKDSNSEEDGPGLGPDDSGNMADSGGGYGPDDSGNMADTSGGGGDLPSTQTAGTADLPGVSPSGNAKSGSGPGSGPSTAQRLLTTGQQIAKQYTDEQALKAAGNSAASKDLAAGRKSWDEIAAVINGTNISGENAYQNQLLNRAQLDETGRAAMENESLARRNQDIQGQNSFENNFGTRGKLEGDQRNQNLKDIYRASYFQNERPGPYNSRGLAPVSSAYMNTLSNLEKQGVSRLATAPQYTTDKMPALAPYTPNPTPIAPYVPVGGRAPTPYTPLVQSAATEEEKKTDAAARSGVNNGINYAGLSKDAIDILNAYYGRNADGSKAPVIMNANGGTSNTGRNIQTGMTAAKTGWDIYNTFWG